MTTRWRLRCACAALVAGVPVTFVAGQARPAGTPVLEAFDLGPAAGRQSVLPLALQEISGLAATGDGRLFAHGDERSVVVQVAPCDGTVVKAFSLGRPPVRGDFEGIAIAGERFFLITSTGILYETREGANGSAMPFTVLDTGFGATCEIEGLAYDPTDRTLLTGCKEPLSRALRGNVSLFRWSIDRRAPAASGRLGIPLAGFNGSKGFSPAGVEYDPRSGHYLVVAGRQRQLAEVTAQGVIVAVRALERERHQQPEGLALLGDTLLVVADEGGAGRARMTCYRRPR
jgi:uncharacterized protein YjiK